MWGGVWVLFCGVFFWLVGWFSLWNFLFCYVLYSPWRNEVILNHVIFSYMYNLLYFVISVFNFLYLKETKREFSYIEQQNGHGNIVEILSTSVSGKTHDFVLQLLVTNMEYKCWDCEAGLSSGVGCWLYYELALVWAPDGAMTGVKITGQLNVLQFF